MEEDSSHHLWFPHNNTPNWSLHSEYYVHFMIKTLWWTILTTPQSSLIKNVPLFFSLWLHPEYHLTVCSVNTPGVMCAADRDTSAQSQGVSLHKNIKSLPNWENFLDTPSLAANRAYLSAELEPKSANFCNKHCCQFALLDNKDWTTGQQGHDLMNKCNKKKMK